MKKAWLLFLIFSFELSAKENATFESLTDLSEALRDPIIQSKNRLEYLEFTRMMMVKKFAQDLSVPENELNLSLIKNPTKINRLLEDPWIDLTTQFYTTLHQENFNQRWSELQKFSQSSEYGHALHKTMMAHLGNYDPVAEGRFYQRWHQVSLNSEERKRIFNLPYFLTSKKIQDLISLEAHVPFEELLKKKDLPLFLEKTAQMKRTERQELAEKQELIKRIYMRAVANASKTIASIHYLTGSLNRFTTEKKVESFLDRYCESCSEKEKKDSLMGAMNYVDFMKKNSAANSVSDVTNDFCTSLRRNKYHWNVDQFKPLPQDLMLDQTRFADYYTVHKLKKKNREAIASTILEVDMGILFITEAMNVMDKKQEPVATKLRCEAHTKTADNNLILLAISEAQKNVEIYISRITKKSKSIGFDQLEANKLIDYFVQTNQAAAIEATSAFPQGIGWILKSIILVDKDVHRRENMDSVVQWGGLIIGVGLTFTGIGAPEGVAMLITTAGLIRGASAGSYFLIRAKQEKQFMKNLVEVRNATSGLNSKNYDQHLENYKSSKVAYIKEFGQTALSFGLLFKSALSSSGGDVVKAETVMKKALTTAKETAKEESFGALQELVIGIAVNGT